jgi:hypothetical protein
LHTGKFDDDDDSDSECRFRTITRTRVQEFIRKLVVRLNPDSETVSDPDPETVNVTPSLDGSGARKKRTRTSMEEEFQKKVAEVLTATPVPHISTSRTLAYTIKSEMTKYENNGYKGQHLTMAYQALLSIPPTSVEAERAFSSAGYFCTKVRSRLSDETLDTLCLLRHYFQKQHHMKSTTT